MRHILWMIVVWICLLAYRELYQAVAAIPRWSWPRLLAELFGIGFALLALHLYATRVVTR